MNYSRFIRSFGVAVLAVAAVGTYVPAAQAAQPPFNAGRIIDDGVFTNQYAMSVPEIQAFLNSKVPTCDTSHLPGSSSQGAAAPWRCLKDYVENPVTGANNLNNLLNAERTTDGSTDTASYTQVESGAKWITIDLGQTQNLSSIKLWHYYADSRTYRSVVVQLSNVGDFSSGVTTVFNNDTSNTTGQGAATQAEYSESAAGKDITFAPTAARYVRLWSNGSSVNNGNHYVEVAAYQTAGGTNLAAVKPVVSNSMYSLRPVGGISAAQIIYNAAQQFTINPQVLLVTLQKENGLITDSWPYPWQYRTAMGFACPDTAACDPTFYGFSKQIQQGARHLRNFFINNPNWTVPYTPGARFVKYSPDSACGGSTVNITNGATAALYSYTPYQPNAAAIAAGFGSAPCGAYGNRNFFNYFTQWFGSTYGNGISPAQCTAPQINVYRFWSKRFNNSHFFTASDPERNALLNDPNWQYEGVGYCAVSAPQPGYVPVSRYWSPKFGNVHFYTASQVEAVAIARDANWQYEGVAFYEPELGTTDPKAVAINRYWSPVFNNDHFYTGGAGEKAALNGDRNWITEGSAWYAQLPQ